MSNLIDSGIILIRWTVKSIFVELKKLIKELLGIYNFLIVFRL
jgi:hypothetical protein